jgi:hypothetical protein
VSISRRADFIDPTPARSHGVHNSLVELAIPTSTTAAGAPRHIDCSLPGRSLLRARIQFGDRIMIERGLQALCRPWSVLLAALLAFSLGVTGVAAQEQSGRQASAELTNTAPASLQVVPSAPRPAAPAPVGLTGQLADWLQVRGEFRGRLEGFSNAGFRSESNDKYMLDRFRIEATASPSKSMKFLVQLQDARAFDKDAGGQAVPFRDELDLRLAYGEFGNAQVRLRVGRQELVFGDQRLLGHLNWTNTARSFDGVRATIKRQTFQFDVLATSVVALSPDTFDTSGNGNALYGFYGSSNAWISKAVVEPFVLWRQSTGLTAETGGTGSLHQATVGVRVVGRLLDGFDYGTELAAQRGSVAADDVRAWAGHWVIGKTFVTASGRPRLFGEYNHASGDADPADGRRGTFDQLYPTGHDKYGLADQVGWRNVEHIRGGVEFKPKAQWQVTSSHHTWWLASARDALYNAGGAVVARSTAGTAGRRVGQEIDAQVAYTYSTQLQINGGYAYLMPGEFLKTVTPGQAYSYSYLMITYVFVGDRPAAPRGK